MLDRDSVVVGLLVGFSIASVGAYIAQKIGLARRNMGAPERPMAVTTAGTPSGVMQAARQAARACFFWMVILIGFFAVSIGGIYLLTMVLAN